MPAPRAATEGTHRPAAAEGAERLPLPRFLQRHPHHRTAAFAPPAREDGSLSAILRDARAAQALLLVPPATLAAAHDLAEAEVQELLAWVAVMCSPLMARSGGDGLHAVPSRRLAVVFAGQRRAVPIATGMASLDRHLLGGLRPGFVVELTGPAGSGKTRLALQWAAAVVRSSVTADSPDGQRGGDGAVRRPRALWLHTAPSQCFAAQALPLLSGRRGRRATSAEGTAGSQEAGRERRKRPRQAGADTSEDDLLRENLLSMPVAADLDEFRELHLKHVAHFIASQRRDSKEVQLLVLDSLSQLVRRGHSGLMDEDNVQRQNSLVALVQELKLLATQHQLCVLVLTTSTRSDVEGSHPREAPVAAAAATEAVHYTDAPGEFGRMLFHSVNVRLHLAEGLAPPWWGRVLRVVKSPLSGPAAILLLSSADGYELEEHGGIAPHIPLVVSGEVAAAVDVLEYQAVPSFICV